MGLSCSSLGEDELPPISNSYVSQVHYDGGGGGKSGGGKSGNNSEGGVGVGGDHVHPPVIQQLDLKKSPRVAFSPKRVTTFLSIDTTNSGVSGQKLHPTSNGGPHGAESTQALSEGDFNNFSSAPVSEFHSMVEEPNSASIVGGHGLKSLDRLSNETISQLKHLPSASASSRSEGHLRGSSDGRQIPHLHSATTQQTDRSSVYSPYTSQKQAMNEDGEIYPLSRLSSTSSYGLQQFDSQLHTRNHSHPSHQQQQTPQQPSLALSPRPISPPAYSPSISPALLLPFHMQQQRAKQLESQLEDLLNHPPIQLVLREPPHLKPIVPRVRVAPIPVLCLSPFPTPEHSVCDPSYHPLALTTYSPPASPPQQPHPKLHPLAQRRIQMALRDMSPEQLQDLGCHRSNAQNTTTADSPMAIVSMQQRRGEATGDRPTPGATPRNGVVEDEPSPSAPSSQPTTPTFSPNQPPSTENLSQLEYRLNLLAKKSIWKEEYCSQPLSLFGSDAYVKQREPYAIHSVITDSQPLQLPRGTIFTFLQEISSAISFTPSMWSSPSASLASSPTFPQIRQQSVFIPPLPMSRTLPPTSSTKSQSRTLGTNPVPSPLSQLKTNSASPSLPELSSNHPIFASSSLPLTSPSSSTSSSSYPIFPSSPNHPYAVNVSPLGFFSSVSGFAPTTSGDITTPTPNTNFFSQSSTTIHPLDIRSGSTTAHPLLCSTLPPVSSLAIHHPLHPLHF